MRCWLQCFWFLPLQAVPAAVSETYNVLTQVFEWCFVLVTLCALSCGADRSGGQCILFFCPLQQSQA